jgi:ribonucleotide monophosphatase NagD (HAD superfamily)
MIKSTTRKPAFSSTDKGIASMDSILDHALKTLYPFLTNNSRELADAVAQHLETHLGTELAMINGSQDNDRLTASPTVVKLMKKYHKANRR